MGRKHKKHRNSDVSRTLQHKHLSVKTGETTYEVFSLVEAAKKLGRGEILVNGGGTHIDFEFLLNLLGVFKRKQRTIQRLKYAMALLHESNVIYPLRCAEIAEIVFDGEFIDDNSNSTE